MIATFILTIGLVFLGLGLLAFFAHMNFETSTNNVKILVIWLVYMIFRFFTLFGVATLFAGGIVYLCGK
jgi:hypothetical protein